MMGAVRLFRVYLDGAAERVESWPIHDRSKGRGNKAKYSTDTQYGVRYTSILTILRRI